MKREIFEAYVDRVLAQFQITREELFSKGKRADLVDARQLLYYLCRRRPMRVRYIQEYMTANGCKLVHSVIIHGAQEMERKIKSDADYQRIALDIEKSVAI